MNRCVKCGKAIRKSFTVCANCLAAEDFVMHVPEVDQRSPAVVYDQFDGLLLHFCAMCDGDNARIRSDGAAYCDVCWEVWKH
jgi:hypothetical protein